MGVNVSATMSEELELDPLQTGLTDTEQKLRDKIMFVLTVYPRLSPSMLHTGIGPNVTPQVWRPVVEKMVLDGILVRRDEGVMTHLEQFRTFTVIRLNSEVYEKAKVKFGIA